MQAICKAIPSGMVAWEWCHTPWHLHHLPFQKQSAVRVRCASNRSISGIVRRFTTVVLVTNPY